MDATALSAAGGEAGRGARDSHAGGAGWGEVLESAYRVALCLTADAEAAGRLLEGCLRLSRDDLRATPGDEPRRLAFLRRLVALSEAEKPFARAGIAPGLQALDPAAAQVVRAVHALPGELQVATALHCGAGHGPAEVAAVRGTSCEVVQQHLRRGRRLLRERLHDPARAQPSLAGSGPVVL